MCSITTVCILVDCLGYKLTLFPRAFFHFNFLPSLFVFSFLLFFRSFLLVFLSSSFFFFLITHSQLVVTDMAAAAAVRPAHPITDASGYLTSSSAPSNGQPSPSGSRRPSHAATFSPYSNTTAAVVAGNAKPEIGSGKKGSGGILGVPFLRRSTSPQPPEKQANTSSNSGGGLSTIFSSSNPSAPNQSSPSLSSAARPATSGGEAGRISEDRNRRSGRSSVGTSDGSDIAATMPPKVASSERDPKP